MNLINLSIFRQNLNLKLKRLKNYNHLKYAKPTTRFNTITQRTR